MKRLRALIGAAAIMLGATLAPVALVARVDDDICAMACCIADGYCCCKPARASVKGKPRDGGFANAEVSKPCPEGCLVSQASTNIFSRPSIQTATHPSILIAAVAIFSQRSPLARNDLCLASSSPRAPPF
ncbi:MAG: hypothetical protein AB1631_15925 [Acidobacteriota bacterium]